MTGDLLAAISSVGVIAVFAIYASLKVMDLNFMNILLLKKIAVLEEKLKEKGE